MHPRGWRRRRRSRRRSRKRRRRRSRRRRRRKIRRRKGRRRRRRQRGAGFRRHVGEWLSARVFMVGGCGSFGGYIARCTWS